MQDLDLAGLNIVVAQLSRDRRFVANQHDSIAKFVRRQDAARDIAHGPVVRPHGIQCNAHRHQTLLPVKSRRMISDDGRLLKWD